MAALDEFGALAVSPREAPSIAPEQTLQLFNEGTKKMFLKHRERLSRLVSILCLTAMLGACGSHVEDGIAAYRSDDFTKALAAFKREPDNPAALYFQHLMYESGSGVEKDHIVAADYLRRSAVDGRYPPAMHAFGSHLIRGSFGFEKDESLGQIYLEAAIKAGEVSANADLGYYYLTERKLAETGLMMLHLAEGTSKGKWYLAVAYGQGIGGVAIKPELAMRYTKELITMEEAPEYLREHARFVQAENHYYGFGTERDAQAAATVVAPVIETNVWARSLYGWLLFHGEGVAADPERAVRLWQGIELSEDHHRYAAYGLGVAYATGTAVKKDPEKARQLFKSAGFFLGGSELWYKYLRANGFTGQPCDEDIFDRYRVEDFKGRRYESLAAKAYLAYGKCLLSRATTEKDKVKRKTSLLPGAERTLYIAKELGEKGASFLYDRVRVMQADGRVFIGMTAAQVLASKWGKPSAINRTRTAESVTEQWVYGGRNYLYFRNGVLEAIQN